jgi:hypothetical protein
MESLENILESQTIEIPQEEFNILQKLSKQEEKTKEQFLSDLIHDKANNGTLTKSEMIVATLEMVSSQLNETEDISTIRTEIAGDLLVAKISLEFEKNGNFDKKKIKDFIKELF